MTGEVLLGKMPLRADVVLVRREDGHVPDEYAKELRVIVERLNYWSMIEFKSPTDSLQRGDFDYVCGCSHLYCQQHETSIHSDNFNMIVLAPAITDGFRQDVQLRNCQLVREELGVHRVEGVVFSAWVIETDMIGDSVLTLFSHVFLKHRHRIMEQLATGGRIDVLAFVFQQIEQFKRQGEPFMIQHAHTDEMERVRDEVATLLEMLPIEERLAGLSAEQRMAGLSPEERLIGLSEEERALLRRLIDERDDDG